MYGLKNFEENFELPNSTTSEMYINRFIAPNDLLINIIFGNIVFNLTHLIDKIPIPMCNTKVP